jgi:hypothetical protein
MSRSGVAIRAATPTDRQYKVYEEKGLCLLARPNGGRLRRFKYVYGGIEKLLSLGAYPDVPRKLARARRDEARKQVAAHVDPSAQRRAEKSSQASTCSAVAEERLETQRTSLTQSTSNRDRDQLVKRVGPYLGNRPVAESKRPRGLLF